MPNYEQIKQWLEDAEWMVDVEEYDFSLCETMQAHIEEAVELFKEILEETQPVEWAKLPSISVTYGTGTCKGCNKIRGSGAILNGVPCECGYVPKRYSCLPEEKKENDKV